MKGICSRSRDAEERPQYFGTRWFSFSFFFSFFFFSLFSCFATAAAATPSSCSSSNNGAFFGTCLFSCLFCLDRATTPRHSGKWEKIPSSLFEKDIHSSLLVWSVSFVIVRSTFNSFVRLLERTNSKQPKKKTTTTMRVRSRTLRYWPILFSFLFSFTHPSVVCPSVRSPADRVLAPLVVIATLAYFSAVLHHFHFPQTAAAAVVTVQQQCEGD